ncbi:hypothetical protein [Clostridium estertheticum]|uniref:hypothetical protein n=1 Tax=Clostridium estertheticum TaxID=238834 RepID=UPI001C7DB6E0|nr:hypothetical protein [Clostridium estertheticum]MBX4263608.1 hypothetical protein [Clostridium estertheticum]MBX4268943.1 hypothetical protein [Clostridium estertheticum]WLC80361.1 hypothetical protein KTC98_03255 [Clostridium estertheticum]WLC87433.1 hypothetical protein KTC95_15010 [Clostridium estertheticum]
MSKKILIVMSLFIMLLHSTVASAIGFKYVQIFDPKQDKVVKVVQLNDEIHNMVVSSIKDVDSLYPKSKPLTDDGYAIRVPIYPAVKVQGKCLNALVDNVFIIIPQHDAPFFMIFEDDNKLLCFPFKGNVSTLSKILDFKLKS